MIKTMLFDFNGTLLNDMPIWRMAMVKTFKSFEKDPPTTEEYFSKMKKDYLDVYRSRGITASREEINAIYIPEYNRLVSTADVFHGVTSTLSTLKKKGIKMGLLTLQPEEMVTPLLEKFLLAEMFTADYCDFHCKDKAKTILSIAEATGTDLKHVCFMGDTPSDITQGQEAGVRTAAFLTGHLPEHMFAENPPNHVFTSFSQLLRLVH